MDSSRQILPGKPLTSGPPLPRLPLPLLPNHPTKSFYTTFSRDAPTCSHWNFALGMTTTARKIGHSGRQLRPTLCPDSRNYASTVLISPTIPGHPLSPCRCCLLTARQRCRPSSWRYLHLFPHCRHLYARPAGAGTSKYPIPSQTWMIRR